MKYFSILFLTLFFPNCLWADNTVRVTTDGASVYASPDASSQVVTHLKEGRVLEVVGSPTPNGYVQLKTKSGRSLWVAASDVNGGGVESDLEQPSSRHSGDFPKFTYDLGGGAGSVNGSSYTEVNLGLNTFFIDWFIWRNAAFYRFSSQLGDVYGLDTSGRGVLGVGGRALGMTLFAGPGFRFISKGNNAPFLEGGVVVKLAGLAIGVGAKTIYNSMVSSGSANDNQIFLILSGGGSL